MNPDTTQGTVPTEPTQPKPTQPAKKPMKTGKPVSGEVIMDYAMDCLCYNPTTRDWRVHDGIDIAADAGTPVCAAAAGEVYTVYEDDSMGMTVVLRHEGGYVTTYSSLSEELKVAAGDKVTVGQTLGAVGNSAPMESAIGDHVHFSVRCNDQPMDPMVFLKQS
jgi:murein DD-endopeptidase MepM/ murein hydrolase activator NlpD